MWSISGMIMTGEHRITRRRTCPSASMSTTNITRTDVQSTPGLRGERPASNRLSQSLCSNLFTRRDLTKSENIPSQDSWWPAKSRTLSLPDSELRLIFVVPCIMLNSEINPTRCNNCVYSSQWLYSTCFG